MADGVNIFRTDAGGWRRPDALYNERWLARIKRRVVVNESGCWLWLGARTKVWEYGQTTYRGRTITIHRQMYKVVHGVELSRQQYVCHSCDVRHCCNPDHLWLGSNSENQKDSSRKERHYESRRNSCERGHEFSQENTIVRKTLRGTPRRVCKTCERIRYRLALGWTEEEAASVPVIIPGTRTTRRDFSGGRGKER